MLKYPLKLNNSISSIRNVPNWLSQQIQIRSQSDNRKSSSPSPQPTSSSSQSFKNEIKERLAQAKRSIFIETATDSNSIRELLNYCSRFGRMQAIYRKDVNSNAYFLIEFCNSSIPQLCIESAVHSGKYIVDGKVRSNGRFLYFNPTNQSTSKLKSFPYKCETNVMKRESILSMMRKENTFDDQIMALYRANRLSDLSYRLRFLTALQIEEAISGMFYQPQVLPFGSSINGFGRMQSDLDMILLSIGNKSQSSQFGSIELGKPDDLVRNITRNNLFVLSGIARHWLQGVDEVTPVLNARVPIIKYVHQLTQLECDLSMNNYSGFQMSEMLYTFGKLDKRLRPLTFYIRAWAKEFNIIQSFPSPGISNFMLTCMVIFFLQHLPKPILPPANAFVTLNATSNDETIPYITDTSKLNFKSQNTSTLAELVVEFFDFYRKFNYAQEGLSILTGTIKSNVGQDSIYIYNPLEKTVNVCRNVNDFERNQFVEKCEIAIKALTQDRFNAISLLEYYKKDRSNMDGFVNGMLESPVNPTAYKNKNQPINVKDIVKSIDSNSV